MYTSDNQFLGQLLNDAVTYDAMDPLKEWIQRFPNRTKIPCYGKWNSLGLPGIGYKNEVVKQAEIWEFSGHDGHFEGDHPWWIYHEWFESHIAKLLGCDGSIPEACVGNTLSVNTYIFLVEFMKICRDTKNDKHGVLSLSSFFSSDTESLKSAVETVFGYNFINGVEDYLTFIDPDQGDLYSTDYIKEQILKQERPIGLLFLPIICHKTGQRFDVEELAKFCQEHDIFFGLDLAHGIGNIPLSLSDWGIDFATWCTYKYLCSGPGAVGGFYLNQKNFHYIKYPKGWWGNDKNTRFLEPKDFQLAKGARRMLLSNDQIQNMGGFKVYLQHQNECFPNGLIPLYKKHQKISDYTFELLSNIDGVRVITPEYAKGCQVSFRIPGYDVKNTKEFLELNGCGVEDRLDVLRTAFIGCSLYAHPAMLADTICKFLQR